MVTRLISRYRPWCWSVLHLPRDSKTDTAAAPVCATLRKESLGRLSTMPQGWAETKDEDGPRERAAQYVVCQQTCRAPLNVASVSAQAQRHLGRCCLGYAGSNGKSVPSKDLG